MLFRSPLCSVQVTRPRRRTRFCASSRALPIHSTSWTRLRSRTSTARQHEPGESGPGWHRCARSGSGERSQDERCGNDLTLFQAQKLSLEARSKERACSHTRLGAWSRTGGLDVKEAAAGRVSQEADFLCDADSGRAQQQRQPHPQTSDRACISRSVSYSDFYIHTTRIVDPHISIVLPYPPALPPRPSEWPTRTQSPRTSSRA